MFLSNNLIGMFFALCAAFAWGTGDFGGGVATRKNNQFQVLVWSSISGLVVLIGCVLIWNEGFPAPIHIIWGVLAGIMGAIGMAALYRGLSLGHAASVAPFSAVITAILPVLFSSFTQGFPGIFKWIGFVLALLGIWFVAHVKSETPEDKPREGILLAFLAGFGFGCFFILIAQFPINNVFVPLIVTRGVALITALVMLAISRLPLTSPKNNPTMLWVGVLDVFGNIFYVLARQYIRLDMVAVLASLYPAATVLWARIFLKEKISGYQGAGILLCLLAIILITL